MTLPANVTMEETYSACFCHLDILEDTCRACKGTGFYLSQRVVRTLSPTEQGAHAQIRSLTDIVAKGISTLLVAADRFLAAGLTADAAHTRAAATAMREAAGLDEAEG